MRINPPVAIKMPDVEAKKALSFKLSNTCFPALVPITVRKKAQNNNKALGQFCVPPTRTPK